MKTLSDCGFVLMKVIKGVVGGYPNDVAIYHRIIIKEVAYQEVRVDLLSNKLAFENNFGNTAIFKVWLGVQQVKSQDNLEIKYY